MSLTLQELQRKTAEVDSCTSAILQAVENNQIDDINTELLEFSNVLFELQKELNTAKVLLVDLNEQQQKEWRQHLTKIELSIKVAISFIHSQGVNNTEKLHALSNLAPTISTTTTYGKHGEFQHKS